MKLLNVVFLGIVLSSFLYSCSSVHSYYVTDAHQVPLFTEQWNYRIGGSFGASETMAMSQGEIAVSFPYNIALSASFFGIKNAKEYEYNGQEINFWRGKYIDGAIGYYRPLKNNFTFEIFAGYGNSIQRHSYSEEVFDMYLFIPTYDVYPKGSSQLRYHKFYLQSTFGYKRKMIEVGLTLRLSGLDYYAVSNSIDPGYSEYNKLKRVQDQSTYYFMEPAVTARFGFDYFKFQVQYGGSLPIYSKSFSFDNQLFSVGLQVSFSGSKKGT